MQITVPGQEVIFSINKILLINELKLVKCVKFVDQKFME